MTELRPFQKVGVRKIYEFRGRALLADEQGLGKTIQSLAWLLRIHKFRPAIIVTTASMKYTWQAEAAMHFNMRTEVLDGYRPKNVWNLPGKICILNYDILDSWLDCILDHNPPVIILDEIHFCKNPEAQRSKAACELVRGAVSVVGCSGTPLTNKPIELWGVMRLIRPDLFPERAAFGWRYCKPRFVRGRWRFDGAQNTRELNEILVDECMIRRLKRDVAPELPDKIRCIASYRLPRADMEEYQNAQDNFLGWLRSINAARANNAQKNPALTKIGYLLRLVADMKLKWVAQWVEEFLQSGKKLVGFTMHTFVIDYLKKRFPEALVINGSVTGIKRVETVRAFQSNPRKNLLLGNWRAAGVGLTLTAAYNAVVFDLPWTPGDLLQGEDRIHRIGQTKDCTIHYLIVLGTIEEKLMRILRTKFGVVDDILNGEGSSEDLTIFDELLREMQSHATNM